MNVHISTRVVTGDITRLGNMVVGACVRPEARHAVRGGLRGRGRKRVLLITPSTKHHEAKHRTISVAVGHSASCCGAHSPGAIQRTCWRND